MTNINIENLLMIFNNSETLDIVSIIIRLLLAIICGGVIGFERSIKHMAAGFRTHMLVCVGAALAMMTNIYIFEISGSVGDLARLGAQVISGIGFIGAGTIIVTSRNKIRGLTTAAGLWTCACLGLAIGVGFYSLVIISTVLIVIIFSFLPKFEKFITMKSKYFEIHVEFLDRKHLSDFIFYIRSIGLKITAVEYNPAYSNSGLSVYTITLFMDSKYKKIHTEYIEEFSTIDYVYFVESSK